MSEIDVVDAVNEKKYLIQDITVIESSDLLETVLDIKAEGYRLGQICATKEEDVIEVLYSFDKDVVLKNLKLMIGDVTPVLQSISSIYWPAFIYENEMHDLFGITFKNLALDFGGQFFKISEETPWNPSKDCHCEESSDAAIRDESEGSEA